MDYKEQVLWTKKIQLVKVFWQNHGIEETSWELEQDMKNRDPHLFFKDSGNISFLRIVYKILLKFCRRNSYKERRI
jgi:hypothetical protein